MSVHAAGHSSGIAELDPLIRRVVGGRLRDQSALDDVVQETLARTMAARIRLDDGALAPYAIVTARNLVSGLWRREERSQRHLHRLVDRWEPPGPDDDVVLREQAEAVAVALAELPPRERLGLVAHELEGRETASLAEEWGSTPGAVAAQLKRARAKLRVEYLLALGRIDPPTPLCRPVLMALSGGERRRQRELEAGQHLLECDFCSDMGPTLLQSREKGAEDDVQVPVECDADVVAARQRAREVAAEVGFSGTDLTLISTAVSEIARNIVQFARRGEVVLTRVEDDGRSGVRVVARDAGPGIADLDRAEQDGFSTYGGMGLGLPGCRRLMDEFEVTSKVDKGTTVVMTKWRQQPN